MTGINSVADAYRLDVYPLIHLLILRYDYLNIGKDYRRISKKKPAFETQAYD